MKLYLAGPMRSIPHFNFPAFHKAAASLRACGHTVFSPADRDEEIHGDSFSLDNHAGDEAQAKAEYEFDLRQAMCDGLTWLCEEADAIALLPGWEYSKGARAERATAEALGLGIYRVADLIRLKETP